MQHSAVKGEYFTLRLQLVEHTIYADKYNCVFRWTQLENTRYRLFFSFGTRIYTCRLSVLRVILFTKKKVRTSARKYCSKLKLRKCIIYFTKSKKFPVNL